MMLKKNEVFFIIISSFISMKEFFSKKFSIIICVCGWMGAGLCSSIETSTFSFIWTIYTTETGEKYSPQASVESYHAEILCKIEIINKINIMFVCLHPLPIVYGFFVVKSDSLNLCVYGHVPSSFVSTHLHLPSILPAKIKIFSLDADFSIHAYKSSSLLEEMLSVMHTFILFRNDWMFWRC